MHIAERKRIVVGKLAVEIAVSVGHDDGPVIFSGEIADERFGGRFPIAGDLCHSPEPTTVLPGDFLDDVLVTQGGLVEGSPRSWANVREDDVVPDQLACLFDAFARGKYPDAPRPAQTIARRLALIKCATRRTP